MPDAIGTIKTIAELVKKYNDLELMKQIIALQTEVFDLETENLTLKKQATEREKMHRKEPHGYYYKEGDPVPHCPKCWERDSKAITLPALTPSGTVTGRLCRVCEYYYKESDARHQGPQSGRVSQWS
jgi:hypothetical protein